LARRFQEISPDFDVDFVAPGRDICPGDLDYTWFPRVSAADRVAISCNLHQLKDPGELKVLMDVKLRIVYIPNDLTLESKLLLLQNRQSWLARKYRGEPRPFAFSIGKDGRPRRVDLRRRAQRLLSR
jgi:hypothetical protein